MLTLRARTARPFSLPPIGRAGNALTKEQARVGAAPGERTPSWIALAAVLVGLFELDVAPRRDRSQARAVAGAKIPLARPGILARAALVLLTSMNLLPVKNSLSSTGWDFLP